MAGVQRRNLFKLTPPHGTSASRVLKALLFPSDTLDCFCSCFCSRSLDLLSDGQPRSLCRLLAGGGETMSSNWSMAESTAIHRRSRLPVLAMLLTGMDASFADGS
jgi:hypothetical protein